ncbi:hypothetical protein [Aquabacterium sp.]|uniref:hypothetical protein n=1 Tax=Aquabacterium sp. TaxID=1872578 RepID=UPI0035B43C6D
MTLTVMAAMTGAVYAAQDELDTDLMQGIEDTNKSMASNIATRDGRSATAEARELTEAFAKVEAFYTAKGDAPDAVELARKSKAIAGDIAKLVEAGQFDAAVNAATDLSRTCKTCHNFYKKS